MRDVLARLDGRASYERTADPRHVSSLASIRRLLADLGNPEKSFKSVHVAGTHGKGLTATMIASILTRDGSRTGLYTSPWVRGVREEVQIDGAQISEATFTRLARTVLDLADGYGESVFLSRFDLTTAVAFLAFAEAAVDWAVVEAGLGGRLDSTNVLDKALAVVTPIDYDHTAVLGESLAEIAGHKLGILRDGVPAVLAEPAADWMEVLEGRGLQLFHGREIEIRPHQGGRCELRWPDGTTSTSTLPPRLPTRTYLECARTALVSRWRLSSDAAASEQRSSWVEAALAVTLAGRLTYLEDVAWKGRRCETVILDGCHSPASLAACASQLGEWGITGHTLVLGMARDKLTGRVRRPLAELGLGAREVVVTPFDSPRAAPAPDVAAFLAGADPRLAARLRTAGSVAEAMDRVSPECRAVVFAGSLYLIREVLPLLECEA